MVPCASSQGFRGRGIWEVYSSRRIMIFWIVVIVQTRYFSEYHKGYHALLYQVTISLLIDVARREFCSPWRWVTLLILISRMDGKQKVRESMNHDGNYGYNELKIKTWVAHQKISTNIYFSFCIISLLCKTMRSRKVSKSIFSPNWKVSESERDDVV